MEKFEESNICPICGGRLISIPVMIDTYPPQYRATCEKCNKTFTSFHPIGFSSTEELPSGMWCEPKTDSKIRFVHLDTVHGPINYRIDSDGRWLLIDDDKEEND